LRFYVIRRPLPLAVKLAIVAAATFLGSLVLVELIRRILRFGPPFGLKSQRI